MVAGGPVIGRVDGELRITTDKVDDDVHDGLEEAGKVGDKDMKKLGKDLGETFDEELKKSTKHTGRSVMHGIISDLEHEGLKLKTVQLDADGNVVRSWFQRELKKGEREVQDLISSGGFKKIGSIFTDAIGSGFNVSGKSSLIAILVPLVGFIGELIAGALQLVNGLVATLTVIPNAIGAIILQVGVLFLAFKGLGTAIQGAFAATNAEELQKALEGLTPAAQDFVKTLLPLRDVFKELGAIAQESFFDRIAQSLQRVIDALVPILRGGIGDVASALGDVARGILNVLANPVFTRFLTELIPATVDWLHSFNSAFQDFLIGLADLGHAVMPFFSWLGESLNKALSQFGVWLANLSVDPDFLNWLERMKTTLSLGADALASMVGFIKEFFNSLDKAGGNEALNDIRAQFDELAKFTKTDEGVKSLEGLLHIIQLLAYAFVFMVNSFILFAFLFEINAEFLKQFFTVWLPGWFNFSGGKIMEFIRFLGATIGNFFTKQIPEFFNWLGGYIMGFVNDLFTFVGGILMTVVDGIGSAIGWLISLIFSVTGAIASWIADRISDIGDFFSGLGSRIAEIAGDMWNVLYQAGRNLIGGLINGVRSMFGALGNAVSDAVQVARNYLPFSPAKVGPLSGSGDPLIAGQKIIQRIATGMEMEAPALSDASADATSNVVIGANAVQMNFYGATPTTQQASNLGAAAGGSLAEVIAQRNARLAIRSIGSAAATA
jgi:phage-related protein